MSSGPAFRTDASNTAADQAQQIGFNHDGMHYFALGEGAQASRKGLLVLNHEYVDTTQIYPASAGSPSAEQVAKALAAHGVSVVQFELRANKWRLVDSSYNCRITGSTPVTFSGPVDASHPAVAGSLPPEGTLNNCANGFTPWGTYLTCEENWNQYFGTASSGYTLSDDQARHGVTKNSSLKWHESNPRFGLAANPDETNRFGWIVEIDPFDPNSTPVKRTALGRFKHEGATYAETAGVAVFYSGDDENSEYIYKFVGSAPWQELIAAGRSPLDEGTLYVARFNDDGTGDADAPSGMACGEPGVEHRVLHTHQRVRKPERCESTWHQSVRLDHELERDRR